ncbi:phage tail tape-measure protein [Mesorhizobium sp. B1-1-4]|uniref:phage tail length tape measure family protein n=1 Tax=Mesorhizobium sp. B1-1-4 TaxID=2589980 RepID=UPI00112E1621|nr:phage tail length tape measure family protein [Mesorhizobium sp. B1-1-4]TPN44462.1 phage tail tape-measure protein [Mesorhizobium sp. B1-1-4]
MADIATLGLSVDSSQVDRGTLSLTRLSGAAKQAEVAANGIATGARGAAAAAQAVVAASDNAAGALTREAAAARQASSALNGHARGVNDNARRMSGSMSGLAAQFQDIGVTAAAGMSPAIIGLQQGAQIAGQMEMAMAGGASAVSVLGNAFKSLLSPVTFVAIGLTTLAAAGLQMVNWPKAAASALNSLASILQTIAPYAIGAAAALALLYAPAIFAGITALSEAILGVTARLAGLAIGFALANPAAAFVIGITAAVAAANIFRDELTQIFGVDIVGAAKDAVNWVIGAFVGGFQAIKAVWGQLPAALGDIVYSTAQTVVTGIESMVQSAVGALNDLTNKAALALAKVGHPLNPEAYNSLIIPPVSFKAPTNPYAGAATGALGSVKDAFSGAMGTDYVGTGMDVIAKGASAASGKLKELAEWLGKVDEKKRKSHGGKTDAEKYSDIVDGANRRIASLQAEYVALGMTDMAAAKLAYETDLLNEAQRKGITLSATQKAELSGLADRMAALEIATKNAKEAIAFAKDITKGFVDDLRSGLEQGKGFWESFGNAALNVLDKIADKLLNDVLDAIFKVSSASSSSGGGFWSILGGLFGLGGGGLGVFPGGGSVNSTGGLWADGGYTGAGGKYEPAGVVHKGEYVFSAAATRAIGVGNLNRVHGRAKGYAGGGYVDGGVPRLTVPANQNGGAPVIQIIDQRTNGGTIERDDQNGITRLIVRDEIKRSGLGTVQHHAALHQQAVSERFIR